MTKIQVPNVVVARGRGVQHAVRCGRSRRERRILRRRVRSCGGLIRRTMPRGRVSRTSSNSSASCALSISSSVAPSSFPWLWSSHLPAALIRHSSRHRQTRPRRWRRPRLLRSHSQRSIAEAVVSAAANLLHLPVLLLLMLIVGERRRLCVVDAARGRPFRCVG